MVNTVAFSINSTKKMSKHSIVSLAMDYQQHMWAINFNGLLLDLSALCKCRLIALHKPFNTILFYPQYVTLPPLGLFHAE